MADRSQETTETDADWMTAVDAEQAEHRERMEALADSERAAIREQERAGYERRIAELETELDLAQRFAHGEGEGRKSWRNRATAAQERIASLEAQLASARWIRCSERLPPLGEWVTVANRERVVQRVAWRLLNTGWWECDLEEYDCAPPGTFLCWQPLPEPPAAQKEG